MKRQRVTPGAATCCCVTKMMMLFLTIRCSARVNIGRGALPAAADAAFSNRPVTARRITDYRATTPAAASCLAKTATTRTAATKRTFRTTTSCGQETAAAAADTTPSFVTERMRQESEADFEKLARYYEEERTKESRQNSHPLVLPRLLSSPEEAADFIEKNIDVVLFDCDGVLYRSPDPAPGARECIRSLLKQNKQVYFVTNNAGQNRKQLRDKLLKILDMDDHELTEAMMISASYSAAEYVKQEILSTKSTTTTTMTNNAGGEERDSGTLYVIGTSGLCDELRDITKATVLGGPSSNDQPSSSMTRDELAEHDFDAYGNTVDAIVVGHDTEFNFRKLSIANVLLQRNAGHCKLIATNRDAFDLVGADSRHIPGNGALVAALEYCSRQTAINCGKPSRTLLDLIARSVEQQQHSSSFSWNPSRTLMIGDRLDTDIAFGVKFGMPSALVLTGVTTADKIQSLIQQQQQDSGEQTNGEEEEEPLPTVIFPHIGYIAL